MQVQKSALAIVQSAQMKAPEAKLACRLHKGLALWQLPFLPPSQAEAHSAEPTRSWMALVPVAGSPGQACAARSLQAALATDGEGSRYKAEHSQLQRLDIRRLDVDLNRHLHLQRRNNGCLDVQWH